MASLFLLANTSIGMAFVFFWFDLQVNFRTYLKETVTNSDTVLQAHTVSLTHSAIKANQQRTAKSFGYKLVPRPGDLISKGSMFVLGFYLAWAYYGEDTARLKGLATSILGRGTPGVIDNEPLRSQVLPTIMLGLLYFLVSEVLVQQAKLLWDDIRDYKLDKHRLGMNRRRALATGSMSLQEAVIHMPIRWVLGLMLAVTIDPDFFYLLLAVSVLQIIYEFMAKPLAGSKPLLWLVVVSLGLPMRFLAGALALGTDLFTFEFIVYAVLIYFVSLGSLVSWMVVEIDEKQAAGQLQAHLQDRPQAKFFQGNAGLRLQRWGLTASVLCGCLLATHVWSGPALETWLQSRTPVGNLTQYIFHAQELFQYLIALMSVALPAGVAGYMLQRPVGWLLNRLVPLTGIAPIRRKTNKTGLTGRKENIFGWLLALLVGCVVARAWNRELPEGAIALVVPILLLFLYERITYREFSLQNFSDNLPLVKKAWAAFLFDSTAHLRFKDVFALTTLVNSDSDRLRTYVAQFKKP